MATWKFWKKPSSVLETVRNLTGEEKQTIKEYLDDGFLPNEISRILSLPLGKVQIFADAHIRQQRKRGIRPSTEVDRTRAIEEQIRLEKAQAELEILKQQNALMKQERELQLEMKKVEIDEKKAEVYGEPNDDDEMSELFSGLIDLAKQKINTQGQGNQGDVRSTVISRNSPAVGALTPTSYVIPQAQPPQEVQGVQVTDEQIYNALDSLTDQQYDYVMGLSDEALRSLLVQKFPQISEQSIQRAIQLVHEEKIYGSENTTQASTNS